MPNLKITAMPSLGGNQVPTDLVTAVDLSEAPVNQNVKSTLNDLFAVITKNITDRAIRFQAPGSAPAVSSANQGALYHNGTAFLASSNGGAYEPLYTLSAQSAALVFAGPTSGPAATPTFRSLALTDLPQIATASLLGRVSAGTGTPEQIMSTAALLTWLQTPSSANLLVAVTDETGGGLANDGLLVFNQSPTIVSPSIANIRSGSGQTALRLTGSGSNNFVEIVNAAQPTGPTIQAIGTPQADISLLIKSKGTGNVDITGSAIRAFGPTTADPGILEARGGNQPFGGGKIFLYERSNNGTNYVGFEAPDSLASDIFWTLPSVDGTAGQALVTDGGSGLSWASFVSNSIATNSFLGRTAAGTGPVQTLTAGAGVLSWLQTPTADNLRSAVTGNTGTGDLVFATGPTISSPNISSGNLNFSGLGQALLGDMSNGNLSNRFYLQTSTANSLSALMILPTATSATNSNFQFYDRNDFSNNSRLVLSSNSATGLSLINSLAIGTVTGTPLALATNSINRITMEQNGNIAINGTSPNFGGGVLVVHIANANTTPSTFPTGGGILYVSGGALHWRGPSTDTQIAPA